MTLPVFAVEHKSSSLIGKRKPPAKKLGAKKGLGGQKINKSFSEIELQAEQDEKMRQSRCTYSVCRKLTQKQASAHHESVMAILCSSCSRQRKD